MAIDKSEKKLIEALRKRPDPEAERLKRFLAMPDLTRTPGSPLADLVRRIASLPRFAKFSAKGGPAGGWKNLKVPEIIPYDVSFDLFNFPKTIRLETRPILILWIKIMFYAHIPR